ncbi:MAG: beta-galactosidase [Armatimonadota bacterium]|nr:beta-galactosidase [Armatimonadota bacterium]
MRSSRVLLSLIAVVAAFITVAGGPAAAYEMSEPFYTLTEEYVSPHIPWAKPYAGGKIRALFVVPRGTAREVIEVAERLSMDYEVVLTLSDTELGWTSASSHYALAEGISQEDMITQLQEKLSRDYDVIVTGHLDWDMFPLELLYQMMEKVHDGTGLVHSYSAFGRSDIMDRVFAKPRIEAPFVSAGVPWQALPVWRDLGIETVLETRQFHEGRMALLNHGSTLPRFMFLTPKPDDTDWSYRELHYEYYQSLAIKAMLWAARREPQTLIASIGVGGRTVARSDLPQTRLTALLSGPTDGLTAHLTLQDEDKRQYAAQQQPVTGSEVSFALPTVPAGSYFADLSLRSDDGVVNWGSVAFTVTSVPSIQSVTLENAHAQPGDTVTAQIALGGARVPAGSGLTVEVTDNLGRVIARKYRSLGAGMAEVQVPFRVSNPIALSADVQVSLQVDGETIDRDTTWLYTPLQRTRGTFAHAVWSAVPNGNEFVRRLMYRQLHECGVDMMTNSPRDAELQSWAARSNFDTIPYSTRYHYSGDDLVRKPCLTDPDYLSEELGRLEELGASLGPYKPRAYTLGDECFLARGGTDVCFSETCVADLRQWLRDEYDSVDALNDSWGTDYGSFEEAEPITLADAREADQPARWVDHRRHMEFVYARMMARAREAIRRGDPGAEVGFDGPFATTSFSGNDWWRLMSVFDICNLYERPEEWEAVRSFADEDDLLGVWYGGYFQYRTEDSERLWPWRALLNGFNSMWWYAVYHGLTTCPMDAVTPSMTIYDPFRWASEEIAELKRGPAKALMEAQRLHDGIAVHYSQSSVHAATWDPTWGALDSIWRQTYRLLEDMGLQYDCYAYAQLEEQGLSPEEYPVFLMPCSRAISETEAQAIREYVNAGGTVIADVEPAVCDHHGRPVTPGLLDDLFGIERIDGGGQVTGATGLIDGMFADEVELPGLDVDGNVRADGAEALGHAGEVPLLLVKETGQGRTVLLNYGFPAADRARLEPEALDHWRVLRGLLAMAGVQPRVSVTLNGEPLRALETVRYADGPVHYLGFIKYRTDAEEQSAVGEIATGEAMHTWDVRTGEYLGEVARWESEFVPSRGKLFARLPYRVEGLTLNVQRGAVAGNERETLWVIACPMRLLADTDAPGRHWVHVTVIGPDGQERRHYARNVPLTDGAGVTYLPMALNDPPGTWTVQARDVISGQTARATFELPQ